MQTIKLGSNGPTVTALGVGTWAWGDTLFWAYGKDFGAKDVAEAFQASVEAGITFFDTAEVYGLTYALAFAIDERTKKNG